MRIINNRKLNTDGADESELEAAIKASMDDMNGAHEFPQHLLQEQENYNNDIQNLVGGNNQEDDELAQAIALSLQAEGNPNNQSPDEQNAAEEAKDPK